MKRADHRPQKPTLGAPFLLDQRTQRRLLPAPLHHPSVHSISALDLPGFKQVDSYSCGFVAGAMVIRYFHPHQSLRKFFHLCHPSSERGISTTALIHALRASKIRVSHQQELDFPRIAAAIAAGAPIITAVHTPFKAFDHWAVIYGCARHPNRLLIAGDALRILNPTTRRHTVTWPEFTRSVWATRGFGLICHGK